jgi:nucleotide-binding universal stress UspA family protein
MKVLIAVDNDDTSREALAFAERLVTERDEVVVLNVTSYSELLPFTGDPFGAGIGAVALDPNTLAELDDRAEELVERSAEEIEAKKTKVVVEHGSPGERICATAAENAIELIILGSHERGAFGRFVHGSVSDYVVHHAPCPVLVVRHANGASAKS